MQYMVSRITKAVIVTSHILRHPSDNLCGGEWLLNISSSIIGLMFPGFPVLQIIRAASEICSWSLTLVEEGIQCLRVADNYDQTKKRENDSCRYDCL
jgi:hypothetical protein